VALPFVSGLLVLDSEGNRVAVKYFDTTILGSAAASAVATAAAPAAAPEKGVSASVAAAIAAAKVQEAQLKASSCSRRKCSRRRRETSRDRTDTTPFVRKQMQQDCWYDELLPHPRAIVADVLFSSLCATSCVQPR